MSTVGPDAGKCSFAMAIKTDSVDTANKQRDAHLQSPDFFNAKQFPTISFQSTAVKAVKDGFALSEASHTPVMLQLRIRACHVHGAFVASDNRRTDFTLADALAAPRRDTSRIVLPPASFTHEIEKVRERWPAAIRWIQDHALNEFFAEGADDVGIVVQGGMYNTLVRALERLGFADVYGRSKIPLYVMNVVLFGVVDLAHGLWVPALIGLLLLGALWVTRLNSFK